MHLHVHHCRQYLAQRSNPMPSSPCKEDRGESQKELWQGLLGQELFAGSRSTKDPKDPILRKRNKWMPLAPQTYCAFP